MSVGAEAGATADVGATSMDFRGAGFAKRLLYNSSNKGPTASGRWLAMTRA